MAKIFQPKKQQLKIRVNFGLIFSQFKSLKKIIKPMKAMFALLKITNYAGYKRAIF